MRAIDPSSSRDSRWNHDDLRVGKRLPALLGLLLLACTDPVHISDDCVPVGEAVRIRESAGSPGRWSVGLVDGNLLFSYVLITTDPDRPATMRAQWFDAGLSATTGDFWLGDSRVALPFEWAAHEGALWAQIWAERDAVILRPIRFEIGIWRLSPRSEEPERMETALPISSVNDRFLDVTPVEIGAPTTSAGADGRAPAVIAFGAPTFAATAIPAACTEDPIANASRLLLFTETTVGQDLSGADPCGLGPSRDGSIWAHDMRLVPLRDEGLGVFFRLGISVGQGHLHYSRVDSGLRMLDTPPVRVDYTTYAWNLPGGFQPQAVAVGSGTLLFTNRDPNSGYNECQELRLVQPDGSSPRDAPYQMRCRIPLDALTTRERGETISQWVVVEPLASGHAVMAYGERTNHAPAPFTARITAGLMWEEGVFLHTIDDAGRRSSEIVRVTPPESTAMPNPLAPRTATTGPIPGDFEVQAVTEGDDVVVAWRDNRPDAPGYYARRFRCTERAE